MSLYITETFKFSVPEISGTDADKYYFLGDSFSEINVVDNIETRHLTKNLIVIGPGKVSFIYAFIFNAPGTA